MCYKGDNRFIILLLWQGGYLFIYQKLAVYLVQ
jgi:hypothetical protein